MRFGAINFPIRPLIGEIRAIAALGFDYIEIAMDWPEASPDMLLAHAAEIRKVISHEGLDAMGHMPTFVSLGDLSHRIQRASLEETLRALEASAALGIKKVTLHPGYARGLQRYVKDITLQKIRDSLCEIMMHARQLGIAVCLENLFPYLGLYVEAEEFQPLMDAFPDAQITMDIAHGQINARKNRSFEFLRRFPDRIAHIHASDTWGGDDQHLPIGAGAVDYPAILKKLNAIGYDQTVTVEVFSPDRSYLQASRENLRRMLTRARERSA